MLNEQGRVRRVKELKKQLKGNLRNCVYKCAREDWYFLLCGMQRECFGSCTILSTVRQDKVLFSTAARTVKNDEILRR